ncbi:MAG TPA: DinB family protein [Acidimicrobiales bacterium]|nr:DinB family protein [Acidimicrobiales bacterium]
MDVSSFLLELYGRIPPLAEGAVDGLDPDQLVQPPAPGANTIAWLVWHVARVEDHHLAGITGAPQVWVRGDWPDRFGLAADPSNTGYGHGSEDVLAVRPKTGDDLLAYLDAVHRVLRPVIGALVPDDLDWIVDRRWDPPVTLGVRLASIADDSLQHLGQAAYARGLLGA